VALSQDHLAPEAHLQTIVWEDELWSTQDPELPPRRALLVRDCIPGIDPSAARAHGFSCDRRSDPLTTFPTLPSQSYLRSIER